MQVMIRNLTDHLLIFALNTGTTIHLGPAQFSIPVDPLEISGNDKIQKLVQAGLAAIVVVETIPGAGTEDASASNDVDAPMPPTAAAAAPPPPAPAAAPPAIGGGAIGKASLSRLQLLACSFVIAGLFLLLSIKAGTFVEIPNNVLALLGVSAGSYLVSKAAT
jgi:hypothetical protein